MGHWQQHQHLVRRMQREWNCQDASLRDNDLDDVHAHLGTLTRLQVQSLMTHHRALCWLLLRADRDGGRVRYASTATRIISPSNGVGSTRTRSQVFSSGQCSSSRFSP